MDLQVVKEKKKQTKRQITKTCPLGKTDAMFF
jgi:hypothetical protein